ncbi:hypothetical protein BC937DRAFT_89503 [Endogone sp. FLAS-F59071]|nr:hypothetical protein BC937DRAFT_89503 [Endogone sp. FLAS-F59071]|eukprot:RUS17783.1 hypothetical protein BC937DRAFT_89503 [Endogone sp. FLAS-F59071]
MSYSLAAKLYIGVTGHYEMASGLIGSLKTNEVSSELRRYLSEGIVFYKALAKKFLAMDANANQNIGTAAGFIKEAKESLHSLVKSTLSKTSTSAIAARAAQEEAAVNEMYAMYTKVNDTVTFQAIPSKADLQTMIPGGRPLLTVKKYTLPPQAFGPVTGKPAEGARYALAGAYF